MSKSAFRCVLTQRRMTVPKTARPVQSDEFKVGGRIAPALGLWTRDPGWCLMSWMVRAPTFRENPLDTETPLACIRALPRSNSHVLDDRIKMSKSRPRTFLNNRPKDTLEGYLVIGNFFPFSKVVVWSRYPRGDFAEKSGTACDSPAPKVSHTYAPYPDFDQAAGDEFGHSQHNH